MLVRSFAVKSRERLARDAFDIGATQSGLAYDVTDTEHWAEMQSYFRELRKTIFNNHNKTSRKNLWCMVVVVVMMVVCVRACVRACV